MPFFGQSDGSRERNHAYHRRTPRPIPTTSRTTSPLVSVLQEGHQVSNETVSSHQILDAPGPSTTPQSSTPILNMAIVDPSPPCLPPIPRIAEPLNVEKQSECNICTPMTSVPSVLKLCNKHANLSRPSTPAPKLAESVNTLRRTPATRKHLHPLDAAIKDDAATLTAYTKETYTRTIRSLRKISSGDSLRSLKRGGLRKVASFNSFFSKDKQKEKGKHPMRGFEPVPAQQTLWNEPVPEGPDINPGVVRRSSRNPDGAEEVKERLAGNTMRMVPPTLKDRY